MPLSGFDIMAAQFQAMLITISRLSAWLAVLVVIFVPLERLFAAHPQKILRRGIGADLGYFFISSLIPAAVISGPMAFLALIIHRAVPSGFLAVTGSWPIWVQAIAALFVSEIGYYWAHRLS